MKTKVFKTIALTVLIFSLLIIKTNAQPFNIGGGLAIGTDSPNVGLKVEGTYGMDFLLENLDGAASFTIFIPSTPNNTTFNRWAVDIDGHYKFYEVSGFNFFALSGINVSHYSQKTKWTNVFGVTNTTTTSNTKAGLNIGAGVIYDLKGNMKAFSEFKFIVGGYSQAEITFGVLFGI